ncbi:hypothetical protein P3S67_011944 [Capsicum chacoense]
MSSVSCNCSMSRLITSPQYFFGLPLPRLKPSNASLSHLRTGASMPLLFTCPNHLNRASRILHSTEVTPTFSRIVSFRTLSPRVSPHIQRNIRISATFIFWMKMNKGFVADLDSLHITPAVKVKLSLPDDENDDLSIENYKQEVQNLRRQLELVLEERDELRRDHTEQVSLNKQLKSEVSELQQEALLIREIPQRLCEPVTTCKDIYKDVFSVIQNFVATDKYGMAKLLSTTNVIGTCLFTALESHFSEAMDSNKSYYQMMKFQGIHQPAPYSFIINELLDFITHIKENTLKT